MKRKMLKHKPLLAILAIALFALNASTAAAQGSSDPVDLDDESLHSWSNLYASPSSGNNSFTASDRNQDNSAFRRLEEGSRIANQASGRNNFNNLGSSIDSTNSNAYFGKFLNYDSWCKDSYGDDSTDCISKDATGYGLAQRDLTLQHVAGRRYNAFNTISPVSAVTDNLNAQVLVNRMSIGLLSPMAVLGATMNLTEPGITYGVMNAMNIAGNDASLSYQADQSIYYRAQANPGSGQMFQQMYESCMARSFAQKWSFGRAQAYCMGGARADVAPGAKQLDTEPGATMMNFKFDPNHPQSAEGALTNTKYNDGSNILENKIRALDYVFNQERSNVVTSAPADQKNSMDALRKSFEDFIGDIEFTITKPEDTGGFRSAETDIPGAGNSEGTIAISTQKIAPRLNPQKFFRNLVIDRYRDYQALLRIECEFVKNHAVFDGVAATGSENPEMPTPDSIANVDDPNPGYINPSNTYANFWGDSVGAHQLLIRLSTTGFQPSPALFDATFAMFLDERVDSFQSSKKDMRTLPCAMLETTDGKPSNLFTLLNSETADTRGRKLAANARDRFRTAFSFSEKIAFGQYLATLAQAEDFIKELTGGSYDSLVREQMLQMIYSVAGTSKIREAIDLNDRQLREAAVPVVAAYNYRNGMSSQGYHAAYGTAGNGGDAASIESGR